MANQTCVWLTDLRHSSPGWKKLAAFLATAEKLSASAHLQNFAKKCSICKFLRQNFVFVNFCNKNLTFFKYPIPKNTTFF